MLGNKECMHCTPSWGAVPLSIRGVLFRNGPDLSRGCFASPLDGDGRIDRFEFRDGRVVLTSRNVLTSELKQEREAGKVLFRHAFGTSPDRPKMFDVRLKNSANTNVVLHGGILLALWEGGLPHAVHPDSLETLGTHSLGGLACDMLPFSTGLGALDRVMGMGGHAVTAHPRLDSSSGRLVTFTTQFTLTGIAVRIIEFKPDCFEPHSIQTFVHTGFTHFHDFGVTADFYVFFAADMSFDIPSFALSGKPVTECISQGSGKTIIYLVPRRTSAFDKVLRAFVSRTFVTHIANAYQDAGRVVVDCMACQDVSLTKVPDVRLFRHSIELSSLAAKSEQLTHTLCEFPTVNPRFNTGSYRYCYFTACTSHESTHPDVYVKRDMRTGEEIFTRAGDGVHTEVSFVGTGPQEDDGFLIGMVAPGAKTLQKCPMLVIIDAHTMSVVCLLHACGANPTGLHGTFIHDGL